MSHPIEVLESNFSKKFRQTLEAYGCYSPCITGNMYTAGQPDTTVVNRQGAVFFIEFKIWRMMGPPQNKQAVENLLKGPQIAVIKHKLWKYGATCVIIAQLHNNLELCGYTDGTSFAVTKWKELAESLSKLKAAPLT
jgi:hypothetical protein